MTPEPQSRDRTWPAHEAAHWILEGMRQDRERREAKQARKRARKARQP